MSPVKFWIQNKILSDPRIDTILSLQGVSWLKRTAISLGTITLFVRHVEDADGVEHIDIDQTISGGIPASSENRTLDWTEHEVSDVTFGEVVSKSKRVKAEELDSDFLKNGWTADTLERGLVQSYVESNTAKSGISWTANQVSSTFLRASIIVLTPFQDMGIPRNQRRKTLCPTSQIYRSQGRGYRSPPHLRLP